MMDYGKYKFDQSKRAKAARKASKATGELKKVRLTPKIAENDIQQKTKRVLGFLQDGSKVQVFVRFRGREQAHPEIAVDVLRRVAKGVAEYARLENKPAMEGRMLSMTLAPRSGVRPPAKTPAPERRDRNRRQQNGEASGSDIQQRETVAQST